MIFCNRCKHFYSKRIDKCLHPDNQKQHTSWRNKYATSVKHPSKLNKNNNCKWFERKKCIQ